MTERKFPAEDELARKATEAAAITPDHLAELLSVIRAVIDTHDNPWIVAGTFIEAAAVTLAIRIPDERRHEAALAAMKLLHDRLRVMGAI